MQYGFRKKVACLARENIKQMKVHVVREDWTM